MAQRSSYLTEEGDIRENLSFPNGSTWGGGYDGVGYGSGVDVGKEVWQWDDATWILAASFIIFTMQTGPKLSTLRW